MKARPTTDYDVFYLDLTTTTHGSVADGTATVLLEGGDINLADPADSENIHALTLINPTVNTAPTDIAPGSFNLAEGVDTSGGVSLGILTASDVDSGESFSFAIVGGADSGNFTLAGAGDELEFDAGLLDHETKDSYFVDIEVTDSVGNTYVETITVDVDDLNEPPIVNNQAMNIDENSAPGTLVGTVAVTDTDPEQGYSRLYWVDVNSDELRRVNLNGSDNHVLATQADGTDLTGTRGVRC